VNDVTQRFLTASIGICTYPQAAPNTEELLKRADLAMLYCQKPGEKPNGYLYTAHHITKQNVSSCDTEDLFQPNYTSTIYALAAAIDAKDHYTFGHSQRVANYVTILANEMSLDKAHIEVLQEAALLHDIGKRAYPKTSLPKLAGLPMKNSRLSKACRIVHHHHQTSADAEPCHPIGYRASRKMGRQRISARAERREYSFFRQMSGHC
jgi:response regulator RpfG family c-di-GMP phosphodiesterase